MKLGEQKDIKKIQCIQQQRVGLLQGRAATQQESQQGSKIDQVAALIED